MRRGAILHKMLVNCHEYAIIEMERYILFRSHNMPVSYGTGQENRECIIASGIPANLNGGKTMHAKMRNFVLTALFIALVLLLGLTPIGLIPLGFVNVTILCVPVIVGTLLLGLKTGLILGLCFGAVSALSAFGIYGTPSALAGALVAASPALAAVMCFLPRLLVPVSTHLVYKLIAGGNAESKKAVPVAAVAGSLTNTVFYLGLMLLFYIMMGINSEKVLALIGGTGLIAGSSEAVVAALISTPVMVALWKFQKQK